jgi:hypothetical protein
MEPRINTDDYIEIINKPGYTSEPVIKGKGVPVLILVAYAVKHNMNSKQISRMWNGYITALTYWQQHPEVNGITIHDYLDAHPEVNDRWWNQMIEWSVGKE